MRVIELVIGTVSFKFCLSLPHFWTKMMFQRRLTASWGPSEASNVMHSGMVYAHARAQKEVWFTALFRARKPRGGKQMKGEWDEMENHWESTRTPLSLALSLNLFLSTVTHPHDWSDTWSQLRGCVKGQTRTGTQNAATVCRSHAGSPAAQCRQTSMSPLLSVAR